MAGTTGSRARRVGAGLLVALPGLLAVACPLVVPLVPEDAVWTQGLGASLAAAPPWLALAWIPWALVGAWRTRLWGPGLLCAVLGLVAAGRPVPLLPQDPEPPVHATRVLVVNVNAFSDDPEPARLEQQIAAQDPDVAIVIEKRALAVPGMVRVADNFADDLPRISHATAVFCRTGLACAAAVTPEFGSDSSRMPLALVRLGSGTCLMGAHAPPPVPLNPTGLRPYLEAVADRLDGGRLVGDWGPCQDGDGVVLSGDLNAVPGMPVVAAVRARGLRDALAGAGVFAASWPAGGGWPDLPVFPLDHLLVGDARVGDVAQVRVPGSDHVGVRFRVW